jgi:tetratricopeptide (TPR) repeat protein
MTKIIWRVAVAVLAIVAISATSSIAQMGYTPPPPHPTEPSSAPRPSPTHGSGPHLRAEIATPLQAALKLQDAKDFAGALAKAREADAVSGKTPEEEFWVARLLGAAAVNMQDYATATTAFNRAVASNAIPDNDKATVIYTAMVLNAQTKNYAEAVRLGEMLMALGPLDEKASVALAQSYYNKGDHAKALQLAQAALAKGVTDPANKAALLQVQTLGQAQSGNQAGAVASLEQQCAEICDGKTWGQLVSVAMSKMHGISNHQALNLFRLQLAAGGMGAEDYLTMAAIDISQGLPAEAQATLEKGIAAGVISRGGRAASLLSQATTQSVADARSLPAFEREAAAKANGEEDIKLGESYYSHGQLAQAETALRRGLGKSGVRDPADAHVILGIVLLAEGKKEDALASFNAASSSASQAPIAHLWTLYANRKG